MPLTVDWSDFHDTLVAAVTGDIDAATAPELRAHLGKRPDEHRPRVLVLDLSEVQFLDSAGLAVLVECAAQCSKTGLDFQLVCTTRGVRRPLEIAGLDTIFTILGESPVPRTEPT
ncbi:STAS domain-containing protein [Amycolatopsis sp. K13G38]|uniref:Anti-sigma factor antagonist n=1 Tax=Amycolatopsis acididurans TaxID=2724524 RepID=A0ABX1JHC0_9PSEU|nr:STAS domain-containing protein [Amycolatopsis acididurans]NKQ58616.1 STAS domain-containing protein [Amycolatopsis acididurans]